MKKAVLKPESMLNINMGGTAEALLLRNCSSDMKILARSSKDL